MSCGDEMQMIKNIIPLLLFFFAICCYAESQITYPIKFGTNLKINHKYIYPLQQAFQIAKEKGYDTDEYNVSIMDLSYNDKNGDEKVFFLIGFDHIHSVENRFEVKVDDNGTKLYLPR